METSKPQHRTITIAVPHALLDAIQAQAAPHRRSLTGAIAWALQADRSCLPRADREQQ